MGQADKIRSRILVVEDEPDIADGIVDGLRLHGYDVTWARDCQTARRLFDSGWDLVILDLMLPDLPGEALMNFMAERADRSLVLILSAKSSVSDKLGLFRQGCDDYLTKPFLFEELLVRTQALLRRRARASDEPLTLRDLSLIAESNILKTSEHSVALTPKETALLKILLRNPGQIVSRKEILQSVWGLTREPSANYIGIHLFKLRKKLSELKKEGWLKTIKFAGYSFSPPDEERIG